MNNRKEPVGIIRTLKGWTFVCEVPKSLGPVTKLEDRKGQLIARTESGTTMIVPTRRINCRDDGNE